MKSLLSTPLLALTLALLPLSHSAKAAPPAHGAAFPVPGDVVPGSAKGKPFIPPQGGGPASPSPAGKPPTPASPAPGAPVTPGSTPPAPNTPTSGVPTAPTTPGTLETNDLTNWSYWWFFNREELLDLRRRFGESGQATGGQEASTIPTRPNDKALETTVLPVLFQLAGDRSQDNMRLSAGIALARIATPEGPRILETLNRLLAERDPTLREGMALALGINGDPGVIKTLSTLLEGGNEAKQLVGYKPNDRVRAFAAYGLGLVADRAANDDIRRMAMRPVLTHFLDTKLPTDLRVALTLALGKMQIEFGATDEVAEKRGGAPSMPRYRRDLIRLLFDSYEDEDDALVRGHLPITLARLLADGPDEVRTPGIERLIARLDERPKTDELNGLMIALGVVGDAWGRPIDAKLRATLFAQATQQRETHARHLAMMALSEVASNSGPTRPPTSVQAAFEHFVLARYEDGRRADRAWLALAAGSFGARLRQPEPGRSQPTNRGRVGTELVEKLRAVVRAAGSADELSAAVLALGLIEDQTAASDIEHLLDTTANKSVRGYAALSLGLMRRTAAYQKLVVLIADLRYDPVALENAATGLALLNRTEGSALLRNTLAATTNSILAAPLAAAIGRVSDSASILPLARMALEKSYTLIAREHAGIALGLISDRDEISWRARLARDVNYAAWTPTLFDSAGKGVLNIF